MQLKSAEAKISVMRYANDSNLFQIIIHQLR